MTVLKQKIAPSLWFDKQGEEAAKFYVSIFKNSKILRTNHFSKEGFETHHQPAGRVMTVEFELEGQRFLALNGGPQFKFSEAISMSVYCADQAEVDYYWSKLTAGGGREGPCGWLKDKFGLSWQIVPEVMPDMLSDKHPDKAQCVTKAFMQMKKLDIAKLEAASMAVETSQPPAEALPNERSVIITRVFDAPRALVWKCWTDEKHMALWFGPKIFTIPVCTVDARIGGKIWLVMRGPDGAEYPLKGEFLEMVEPERLVFINIAVDKDGNHLLEGETTVILEDLAGQTRMTLRTHAVGKVPAAPQMLAGMQAGWAQSFDKLAAVLLRG